MPQLSLLAVLKVEFLDKYEVLAGADIKGSQVKPFVLSSCAQTGQMTVFAFLEMILTEF